MQAADVMTREIVTVRPETPLADAIRLMLERRVSGCRWWTGPAKSSGC